MAHTLQLKAAVPVDLDGIAATDAASPSLPTWVPSPREGNEGKLDAGNRDYQLSLQVTAPFPSERIKKQQRVLWCENLPSAL